MTSAILRLRPTIPNETSSHPGGFITANANMAGASNWQIEAASFHFGPSTTKTTSLAKRAQATVIGNVKRKTSE
jgi:hypothetical protein